MQSFFEIDHCVFLCPMQHCWVSSGKFTSGLDFSGQRFFSSEGFFFFRRALFLLRGHFLGLEKGTASHLEDFEAKK